MCSSYFGALTAVKIYLKTSAEKQHACGPSGRRSPGMAGGSAAEEIIRIVWRFFMRGYLKEESYKDYRDEELVRIAQAGDDAVQDYLLDKYKSLVRAKSRAYFLIGADSEDIIQEGMIGLYKAVRDFNGEKNTSFRSFAELCVNRQMITAIKADRKSVV